MAVEGSREATVGDNGLVAGPPTGASSCHVNGAEGAGDLILQAAAGVKSWEVWMWARW